MLKGVKNVSSYKKGPVPRGENDGSEMLVQVVFFISLHLNT